MEGTEVNCKLPSSNELVSVKAKSLLLCPVQPVRRDHSRPLEAMHEYEPKPNYNWRAHLVAQHLRDFVKSHGLVCHNLLRSLRED